MTALRKEVYEYIDAMQEEELSALRPLLRLIRGGRAGRDDDEPLIIETDLTDEEHALIDAGMQEYDKRPESFMSLDDYIEQRKRRERLAEN